MRTLFVGFLATASLFAQTASLRGTLTDSSGAVIPAANVEITGNGVKKTTQTQADGSYIFPGLADGPYKITVNYPGFVPYEKTVTAQASIVTPLAIQLIPGGGKQ